MKITILGSGAANGAPVIGCSCAVCRSSSVFDKRTRSSVYFTTPTTKILIDTPNEFRAHALKHGIYSLDAVLYTHAHADHTQGISDLEMLQGVDKDFIPLYSNTPTCCHLLSLNPYLFFRNENNSIGKRAYLQVNQVPYYHTFSINDLKITTIRLNHGDLDCVGYIFNEKVAYCTDVKDIPQTSYKYLYNLDILILDCTSDRPSFRHADLNACLNWVGEFKPNRTVFTHLGHHLGYEELRIRLREWGERTGIKSIEPAFDGMELTL